MHHKDAADAICIAGASWPTAKNKQVLIAYRKQQAGVDIPCAYVYIPASKLAAAGMLIT